MSRYTRPASDVPEWVSVSADRPCLVCGASIECMFLDNGDFACCVNVMCERPVLNGGWLHQLSKLRPSPPEPEPMRGPVSQPVDPAVTSIEGRPAQ
jgi:hypothetical protein